MSKIPSKNLTPKILSILFALVMWIYVMSEINPRITIEVSNIPVQILHEQEVRNQGLVIMGDRDFRIRVRLTGRRDEVYQVSREQLQARVDLRGYRAGVNNVPLEINGPNNVEIDFSPRFIRIELEEVVRKQKEVNVVIGGSAKEGYIFGQPEFKPTVVWVEGPESLVNAVERVVARLELNGESQNIEMSLPLKALNSRGTEVPNVDVKTAYIDVSVPVDQLKTITVEPIVDVTTAEGYEVSSIEVIPTRVQLRGQEEVTQELTTVNTKPITIRNLTETTEVNAELELPEGISLVKEEEIKIRINVEKTIEASFIISKEAINFKNVDSQLKIDTSDIPATLQVRVAGPEAVVQSIEDKDIEIAVDLRGLEANNYTIEPVVNLPYTIQRNIKGVTLTPRSINVKLMKENG